MGCRQWEARDEVIEWCEWEGVIGCQVRMGGSYRVSRAGARERELQGVSTVGGGHRLMRVGGSDRATSVRGEG